ncbi:hypothetical protein DPMN_007237 [Dreissena polymorpha]|uniref:Uncharacterized protein n=1 Tax=Dreissena polymorpha TaxID=45954 RepID=A0A9D4MSY2_DREPO|nr:hypothetical protein DPMN_007237 [Dreissena polymorpha]
MLSSNRNHFQTFKLQDTIVTNLLIKFHEDRTIKVGSTVLTRKMPHPLFHDDQIITVAPRVLTRKNAHAAMFSKQDCIINVASRVLTSHISLGSHVFQANVIIFTIIQDIIETNLLTKFHKDWTINVASRVLTRQLLTHDGRRTKAITNAQLS